MEDTKVIEDIEVTEDIQVAEEPQEGEVIDAPDSLPIEYKGLDYVGQEALLLSVQGQLLGRVFQTWSMAKMKSPEPGIRPGGFSRASMSESYNKAWASLLSSPAPDLMEAAADYKVLKPAVPLNYKHLEGLLLKEKDQGKQARRAIYLYGLELYDPKNEDHKSWASFRAVVVKRKVKDRPAYPFSGMNKAIAVKSSRIAGGALSLMGEEAKLLLKALEPAIVAELGRQTSRRVQRRYSPRLSTVTSSMPGASKPFYPGDNGLIKVEDPTKKFSIKGSVLTIGDQQIPARITDIRTSEDISAISNDQIYLIRGLYSIADQSKRQGGRRPYELLSVTERELEGFTGINMRGKWSGKPWTERLGALSGVAVELEDGGINVVASFSRYEPDTKEYFVDVSLFDRVDALMEEYHTREKDGRILPHHLYAFHSDKRIVRDNPNALMMLERIVEGVAQMGTSPKTARRRRTFKETDPAGETIRDLRHEWQYDPTFNFILNDDRLAKVKAELNAQSSVNAKNVFLKRLIKAMREIVADASDLDLIYRDFRIIIPDVTSMRLDKEIIVKHTGWNKDYRR